MTTVRQAQSPSLAPFIASEYRMLSGMRLLLAVTSLAVTFIDPTEPSHFVAATYSTLAAYTFYSALIHLLLRRDVPPPISVQQSLHWVDVAVYIVLIALSEGTNSIYFVLFFFSIIEASFCWGFRMGLAVTAVSVILYGAVGYSMKPPAPEFDLNRFLLRSSALPILGYLIAYLGGYELELRRRLSLLKEISALSNPRFGIDRTLGTNMERLRAYFRADACVAVLANAGNDGFRLYRTRPNDPDAATRAESIGEALADTLLCLGDASSFCYREAAFPRRWRRQSTRRAPCPPHASSDDACRGVAAVLDTAAFLTVPLRSPCLRGRLFLTASKPRFEAADADFASQAVDQFMPILEHVLLVDRMATRAADDERQRIALYIHDRIVQPYIGLKLGLASLDELLETAATAHADARIKARTEQLVRLSTVGVAELRQYVQALRDGGTGGSNLSQALNRYAARFREATGIRIDIEIRDGLQLPDRLADEIFSMIAEGISNVRRHTSANQCRIALAGHSDHLTVRIENPCDPDTPPAPFVPHSITARASALHGNCSLAWENGSTVILVDIPL